MTRRGAFIGLGVTILGGCHPGKARAEAPPGLVPATAIGPGKLLVFHEDAQGRIVISDSATYANDQLGARDVLIAASYAGVGAFAAPLGRGIKGIVADDAGIGKDEAGINGLPAAERHGIPAAAVATMSAEISNGRSVALGVISSANGPARRLGVLPGQRAFEAALLMLAAPDGQVVNLDAAMDSGVHDVDRTPRGTVWAATSSFGIKGKLPSDVLCIGSNCARVFAESMFTLSPRGAMANDAGGGLHDSGASALPLLQHGGIAGAAVAAASARIGDGMSTWRDGVFSRMNDLAATRGVRPGMAARDAARLMLGA